jgi:regulator of nucleoside diphosphate kinase
VEFVEPGDIPADIVTVNSGVRNAVAGEVDRRNLTIVFPEDSSQLEGRLSILAPMAQALLGAHVGDLVSWEAPMGTMQARVEELLHQPEASMIRP